MYNVWSVTAIDYVDSASFMENRINEMLNTGNWELHSFNQFLDDRKRIVSTLIFKSV